MRTDVQLEFGDGRYLFRLTLAGVDEIQRKCKAGMGEVYSRVLAGRYVAPGGADFGNPLEGKWRIEDLIEIIRQGLIGGGEGLADEKPVKVDALVANAMIERYVNPQPYAKAWSIAAAICMACIEGMDDPDEHPVKKNSEQMKGQNGDGGSTTAAPSATSPSAGSRRPKRKR